MSLGMTLIRANTLAFGLIGKDEPHGIIKICFENMKLVFGSEAALLGFWEYMFRILFRVWIRDPGWKRIWIWIWDPGSEMISQIIFPRAKKQFLG
jgi:hypothetical protein